METTTTPRTMQWHCPFNTNRQHPIQNIYSTCSLAYQAGNIILHQRLPKTLSRRTCWSPTSFRQRIAVSSRNTRIRSFSQVLLRVVLCLQQRLLLPATFARDSSLFVGDIANRATPSRHIPTKRFIVNRVYGGMIVVGSRLRFSTL